MKHVNLDKGDIKETPEEITPSMRINNKKTTAFNLIESAIVLGVVGLVIGGIWVAAANVYENYKVSQTVKDYLTISRNMQQLISVQDVWALPDDSTNFKSKAIASKVIPVSWINGTDMVNPYTGGTFSIVLERGTTSAWISMHENNMSSSICIKLVTSLTSIGENANAQDYQNNWNNDIKRIGLARIAVRTQVAPTYTLETRNFPVSLQDATTACTVEDTNILYLNFGFTRIN